MNTQQSDSRKILEDLNFKKQQLQKGLPIISTATTTQQPPYEPQINTAARAIYQQAVSASAGFFVLTDSAFGNSILPVVPRLD